LDMLAIKKIVIKFVNEIKTSLSERDVKLNLSEAAVEYLAEHGYDSKMGARPLGRKIDELIRVPLSKKILFEDLKDTTVDVDVVDNTIAMTTPSDTAELAVPPEPKPAVDQNGYIVLDRFKPRT